MYEEFFSNRLSQLRMKKGVSAREMSLSLGQNSGYIHNIESGKALPSMTSFFYICEYLNITPLEFFNFESDNPQAVTTLYKSLSKLPSAQLESFITIVDALAKNR